MMIQSRGGQVAYIDGCYYAPRKSDTSPERAYKVNVIYLEGEGDKQREKLMFGIPFDTIKELWSWIPPKEEEKTQTTMADIFSVMDDVDDDELEQLLGMAGYYFG